MRSISSLEKVKNRHCTNVLIILCALVLCLPGMGQAKKLIDIIPDLYSGNGQGGFQTDPLFGGGSPGFNEFGGSSLNELNELTNGIGAQLGQFAVGSTVSAFRFDVERGVPVKTEGSLGPLFAERADSLGKGRFDFQVTWSHANYQKFDGDDLSQLRTTSPENPIPGQLPTGESLVTDYNVEVITNFVGFYGTYGILDNWDVNLLVPLVHTKLKASARSRVVNAAGQTCVTGSGNCSDRHVINGQGAGRGNAANDSDSGDSSGIGDVVLRSKLNVLQNHEVMPDLAVRAGVGFPTGDEDNFQGTGDFRFEGTAVASKYFSSPIGSIGPHLNAGVNIVNNQSSRNTFNYVGGFDVAPIPTVAVFLDVLGRHELDDKDNSGKNIVDISPGVKWAPWPHTLFQAAVLVPLNKNEGLRANQIWTAGIGGNF